MRFHTLVLSVLLVHLNQKRFYPKSQVSSHNLSFLYSRIFCVVTFREIFFWNFKILVFYNFIWLLLLCSGIKNILYRFQGDWPLMAWQKKTRELGTFLSWIIDVGIAIDVTYFLCFYIRRRDRSMGPRPFLFMCPLLFALLPLKLCRLTHPRILRKRPRAKTREYEEFKSKKRSTDISF